MKRSLRRVILWVAVIAAVIVVVLGPWFVRAGEQATYGRPLARADALLGRVWDAGPEQHGKSVAFRSDAEVSAGWAIVPLSLPAGTPLAGYGDRRGRPHTGVLDQLEVGAVVFESQGERVALLSGDLLIVPANVADQVRARAEVPVLFSATHTHGGPGATTRGLVARAFGGRYDSEVESLIVETMVRAIERAARTLSPVRFNHQQFSREQFIRNRTRDETAGYPLTDPYFDVVTLETVSQGRLSLLRYSAHATIIPSGEMRFSAGYPGALRSAFEERFGGESIFLAGAVGSMSASVPADVATPRHEGFGELLAASLPMPLGVQLQPPSGLAVVDLQFRGPPVQLRLTPRLRISPIFLTSQGVDRTVRLTAIRLGSVVLLGLPVDLSGEIGAAMRAEFAHNDTAVIPLSFSGDYLGYLSPDAHFSELRDGDDLAYETGIMSWAGPAQERFFVELSRRVIRSID